MSSISSRIDDVKAAIASVNPRTNLMCVTKTANKEQIHEAIDAGCVVFGENRAQDIMAKWPSIISANNAVELHMIGGLQSNKIRDIVQICSVIESVDSLTKAEMIFNEAARFSRSVRIFIQVNTGNEPQKSGVLPREFAAFARGLADLKLSISGLMCIPPADQSPIEHFLLLQNIAWQNNLGHVIKSFGMSNDYIVAARLGSDQVRIGSLIFQDS